MLVFQKRQYKSGKNAELFTFAETSHTVQFPTVFHDIGIDNVLKVQGSIRIHATKHIYFKFIPISDKVLYTKNLMCIDTFLQQHLTLLY
jgi:hypothetical protein